MNSAMKFIIIILSYMLVIVGIDGQTTNTTQPSVTTLTPQTTTLSSPQLRSIIDRRVAQIKAAISTQAMAIVELEALTAKIRENIASNKTYIENFKKDLDDYHKAHDSNFEFKVYLDEVDGEVVLAVNSYADIAHKLNKIICLD